MSDKEKQRFHQMAEKDKKRFESEMANYKPSKNEKGGKRKKRVKDPDAPKRALSAFFWFCNDERPKVKEGMPDSTVGEVAKELGKRWNETKPELKAKYEALAAKDKARYEKVLTHIKNFLDISSSSTISSLTHLEIFSKTLMQFFISNTIFCPLGIKCL